MTLEATAAANIDDVVVAWRVDTKLDGCLGFALERSVDGGPATVLPSGMPFAGSGPHPAGATALSTMWPIQRFVWTDHLAPKSGTLTYRVRPVFGTAETPVAADDDHSALTNPVTRATGSAAGYSLFPNRGIVAAPWIEAAIGRAKASGPDPTATDRAVLTAAIADPHSVIRRDLAGPVLTALVAQLTQAESEGEDVYAALYELTDPELVTALAALGGRAHVILGNGSFDKDDPDPNAAAAQQLTTAGVTLQRRMVKPGHFAHNKFVVFAPGDIPSRVWTGSTNWTPTGLCTQANHAVLLDDPALASSYHAYWRRLLDSGSDYPALLKQQDTNATAASAPPTRAWFAPVLDFVDLADAAALIDKAEQGVLFLMFRPGNTHTLIDNIKAAHDRNLFIRGIVNSDFLGTDTAPTIEFFNASATALDADPELILPDHLRTPTAGMQPEVGVTGVLIHSKVIVLDPFGDHPVVMTGSHNLGQKASRSNDDNLLIVQDQPGFAREFAVYIMNIYDHYRWRYELGLRAKASAGGAPSPQAWSGLIPNDSWQSPAYLASSAQQASLWFGTSSPTPPIP